MRLRLREFLRKRFLIGAMSALAAIMAIAAVTFTADAHAKPADVQLSVITAVQVPIDVGLAITDTAIAAEDAAVAATQIAAPQDFALKSAQIAIEQGIQPGAEQSVPIAQSADAEETAGKETATTATITSSIIYVATMPAAVHFQLPALVVVT